MAKQQKIDIPIPGDYKPDDRESIGFEIIDKIIKRTQDGLDINGRPWSGPAGKYSESYRNSLDFKIAKGKKRKVDLTLSSEMLEMLEVLGTKKGKITIGYPRGDEINGKVEGNIKGTYGRQEPIKGKARNFLGISDKDLNRILRDYPLDKKNAD